jgi:hypothetical protein
MAVVRGEGPAPAAVLVLLRALPDTALTPALAAGNPQMYGWGVDRHLAADLYDAVNANTRATGQWKRKPPQIPRWPRPKPKTSGGKTTVASLHARLGG